VSTTTTTTAAIKAGAHKKRGSSVLKSPLIAFLAFGGRKPKNNINHAGPQVTQARKHPSRYYAASNSGKGRLTEEDHVKQRELLRKLRMTKDAKQAYNFFTTQCLTALVKTSQAICNSTGGKKINSKDIFATIALTYPPQAKYDALCACDAAAKSYSEFKAAAAAAAAAGETQTTRVAVDGDDVLVKDVN